MNETKAASEGGKAVTLRSSVDGIAWPALRLETAPLMLQATLFQLERSQWWDEEEIRAYQFAQLTQLVAHAFRTIPFYRNRLSLVGVKPGRPLSLEDWARIPLLTREEIQRAGDALLSKQIPPTHGEIFEIHTSGSTGQPIRAVKTAVTRMVRDSITIRDHLWHRRDLATKLASIRDHQLGETPDPNGAEFNQWGDATGSIFVNGPSVVLSVNCSIEQQVRWLKRHDPAYLLTFPTNAQWLAEHCLENGITFPNLRHIETIAEMLTPHVRELCREAFGVPIVDMYSSREADYLALQCPDHAHYHVQSEGIYLEVLDDDGRPCRPGEVGRVVVTPLHNLAMPLIRYEIGDYAEVGEPCPCGRGLAVLKRIVGRQQNMLILPGGERRWPLLSAHEIGAFMEAAPIRRYQFVQKSLETVEVRLSVLRPLTAEEEAKLKAWVGERFGRHFNVTLAVLDDLPRTPGGKFQDFVSEVTAEEAAAATTPKRKRRAR